MRRTKSIRGKRSGAKRSVAVRVSGRSAYGEEEFSFPPSKAGRVVNFLRMVEKEEEGIPADEVFRDLDAKYTGPGAVLKGARLKEGLSQVELAKKVGIAQGDVSAMEHGRRPIGKAMAKRLAAELNIDYRVFL